jgi:hypothetical protein
MKKVPRKVAFAAKVAIAFTTLPSAEAKGISRQP